MRLRLRTARQRRREQTLRELLQLAADTVHPRDGLDRIQARTREASGAHTPKANPQTD